MKISSVNIAFLLKQEDVEGLLAAGSPEDEYADEAERIAQVMRALPLEEYKQENILAAISFIWAQSFELGAEEMSLRMPALRRVADRILLLS